MHAYPLMRLDDSVLSPKNRKQGFYSVGGKAFNHKLNALTAATRSGLPVLWNFNYAAFQEQCKKPRLGSTPITDLYKERALQIRDTYQYVILAFSGGVDSDTILHTFIDNDIKLDEVWVDFPLSLIEKSNYVLTRDTKPSNMPSEWFLVIKPALDKLRITNPEIKIHISDSLGSPTDEDNESTICIVSAISSYNALKRYRHIKEYTQDLSHHKTVCVVMGHDKPIPTMNGTEFGFSIPDSVTYFKSEQDARGLCMVEYFYWTPDFPIIATEQAWRVWDYLNENPTVRARYLSNVNDRHSYFGRRTDEGSMSLAVSKICYPNWNTGTHQVDKSGAVRNDQFSSLMYKYRNQRFFQSWESNLNSITAQVGPHHFDSSGELKRFYNWHRLGYA